MRLTVTSHLTLDGVMQSNGKPEPGPTPGDPRATRLNALPKYVVSTQLGPTAVEQLGS